MDVFDQKLAELGWTLPEPSRLPPGFTLPFDFINIRGSRVFVSGHPKSNPDGSIGGPYGQLGKDLTTEQGYEASRDIALSVIANLRESLGDLSRITGWSRVFGMVNSAPGYSDQHLVIHGFSDTILALFGPDVGRHARSAVGLAGLPMNFAIEIEAELEIAP